MKNGLPQMLRFLQTAVCKGPFFSQFPREIMEKNIHITALEVLFILVCLRLWGKNFKGQRILVFCDNMSACQIINTGSDTLQEFLREIILAAIF